MDNIEISKSRVLRDVEILKILGISRFRGFQKSGPGISRFESRDPWYSGRSNLDMLPWVDSVSLFGPVDSVDSVDSVDYSRHEV